MPTPEQRARQTIDALLTDAGWQVQDRAGLSLDRAERLRQAILRRAFEGKLVA